MIYIKLGLSIKLGVNKASPPTPPAIVLLLSKGGISVTVFLRLLVPFSFLFSVSGEVFLSVLSFQPIKLLGALARLCFESSIVVIVYVRGTV